MNGTMEYWKGATYIPVNCDKEDFFMQMAAISLLLQILKNVGTNQT